MSLPWCTIPTADYDANSQFAVHFSYYKAFRDKFALSSRDEDIKFIVGQLGKGIGLELGTPATPLLGRDGGQ